MVDASAGLFDKLSDLRGLRCQEKNEHDGNAAGGHRTINCHRGFQEVASCRQQSDARCLPQEAHACWRVGRGSEDSANALECAAKPGKSIIAVDDVQEADLAAL